MNVATDRESLVVALSDFCGTVETRLRFFQQAQRDVDLYVATRFSVFDYIEPDENRISDIFADLLQPEGKHGQGDRFLRLFLEVIQVHFLAFGDQPIRVLREDRTSYSQNFQRRIDITIDCAGFGIGIENKPWAWDGPDQVRDYREHLRRKYGQKFMLIYLSGNGCDPTSLEASELASLRSECRFQTLAYPTDVRRWLELCARDCEAEKIRWFLRDLAEYMGEKFAICGPEEES